MISYQVSTPVAFLVFNRPDTTRRVFAEIAKVRPSTLLVIADGPRSSHLEDARLCREVRAVIETLDWECQVLTNFADTNMGLRKRISSGLDWAFEQFEEVIVLEDDCLPDPTFFRFCEEMLEKYRYDERVMAITGGNYQFGHKRTAYSYYFSRYNHVWGWASWRRAWKYYDVDMRLWPMIRDGKWLRDIHFDFWAIRYWGKMFDRTFRHEIKTWAFQWTFACWLQSGLTIIPTNNLISNVGFGLDATNTFGASRLAEMELESIDFPLIHPPFVIRDSTADTFTQKMIFDSIPLWRKVIGKLRQMITFAGKR